MIKEIVKDCNEFISNFFPDNYASLISGSFVDNLNNKFSDLDLIIFVSNRDTVFNETLLYRGLKIQAIVVPIQRVQEILWVDYMTAKGGSISMYSKGYILTDTNDFLKNLKTHCIDLRRIGSRKLNANEEYMMRVKISSLLYDIKGINDIHELYFTAFELLDLLASFILIKSGQWCGEGKHKMRQIKSHDIHLYNKLIKFTEEFIRDQNKNGFIDFVEGELLKYGGLLPYYSKGKSLLKVSSDYLTLEIKVNDDLLKSKQDVIFINNLVDKELIKLQIKKSYFFLSKPFRKGEVGNKIYLIICANKDLINGRLLNNLKKKLYSVKSIPKLLFPYQFDPKYEFYQDKVYHIVLNTTCEISNYLKTNSKYIFDNSFQISFALSFFYKIKITWFNNSSKKINSFASYLYKCWLPTSYEDDDCFNTVGMVKAVKNLNASYSKSYYEQEKILKEKYSSNGVEIVNKICPMIISLRESKEVDKIPEYKTYLLNGLCKPKDYKKWTLYKDFIFRIFSSILMDNRLFSYIPYVIKKIESE